MTVDSGDTPQEKPTQPVARKTKPRRRGRLALKLLFSVIVTVVGLLAIEGILTLAGVKPLFYEDPFVGFASGSPLFTEVTLDDGSVVYQTSENKLDWFNSQSFSKAKQDDTYRIFCMGGSTTVGRPYDDKTSFSRWLREFAKAADPDRKIEVINAGAISYASYRVAKLMTELVNYEPDLFVVYTGHNEFLENHTYADIQKMPTQVRNVVSGLSRTRIYSTVHRLINRETVRESNDPEQSKDILSPEVDAILDRTIGPESYRRDAQQQQKVVRHFEHTLHRIIDIAQDAGAEIVLVEPASNLKDCQPFKSQHRSDLTERELETWQNFTQTAADAIENGDDAKALAACEEALKIDDRVASLHFEQARLLWKLQRFDDAREAFIKAGDEDVCPLRVLTSMRKIVNQVAAERNVRLVPYATYVESISEHAVPGENIFLDHVHPTIAGHQAIATLLLDELTDMKIVRPNSSWNDDAKQAVINNIESQLDRNDHATALRNLAKVLAWAGKHEEADRLAIKAADQLQDDFDAQFLAGVAESRNKNFDRAVELYEATIRLNPTHAKAHSNLGDIYFKRKDWKNAKINFLKATKFDPGFATAWHNLGVTHNQLDDLPAAEGFFREALKLEPNRFDSNLALGRVYIAAGYENEARPFVEYAVKLRPENSEARKTLESLNH